MRYKRLIRTAWPAVAAAVAVLLAGCERATVSTPIDFPADKLTLSIPLMTRDVAVSPVTLPEAKGGGAGDLTYRLAPIPEGLAFDASTRVLSGTPTAAGNHSVTYTAMDAAGSKKASLVFTITVRPGFNSTWRATHEWREDWFDEGEVGHFVDTLTFTDDRYILARAHYLSDGTLDHVWKTSGGWSAAAEGTVIREWEDDDAPMSVPKHYVWGSDERNVLFMHHWTDPNEQPAGVGLERYEWVPNPLASLTGVWQATDEWDQGPVVFEMTIGADGTLTWEQREAHGTERITATWTLDERTYFLQFQGASSTWTPPGGMPEPSTEDLKADRIAFAPTDSPDLIIVSPHWHETASNVEDYRRYGDYWMEFRRQ